MLNVENSLVGFPNLDYVSSEKVRTLIEQGKVKRGDLVLLSAFGSGFTWGSVLFEF